MIVGHYPPIKRCYLYDKYYFITQYYQAEYVVFAGDQRSPELYAYYR